MFGFSHPKRYISIPYFLRGGREQLQKNIVYQFSRNLKHFGTIWFLFNFHQTFVPSLKGTTPKNHCLPIFSRFKAFWYNLDFVHFSQNICSVTQFFFRRGENPKIIVDQLIAFKAIWNNFVFFALLTKLNLSPLYLGVGGSIKLEAI